MCDCVLIFIGRCGSCIGQSNCSKYVSINTKEGQKMREELDGNK